MIFFPHLKLLNADAFMKRCFLFLLFALTLTSVVAQSQLAVGRFFTKSFAKSVRASVVRMSGSALSDYDLDVFHSVTFRADGTLLQAVEQAVEQDTKGVNNRETGTKYGRLYYGFFRLDRVGHSGGNVFLFYRNNGLRSGAAKTVTLIYLEGNTTLSKLKKQFGS